MKTWDEIKADTREKFNLIPEDEPEESYPNHVKFDGQWYRLEAK